MWDDGPDEEYSALDDREDETAQILFATPARRITTSRLNQVTNIHIAGVADSHESLGATVARYQSGVNADLLRSLQGSSVG
jgi:hypothetical protein